MDYILHTIMPIHIKYQKGMTCTVLKISLLPQYGQAINRWQLSVWITLLLVALSQMNSSKHYACSQDMPVFPSRTRVLTMHFNTSWRSKNRPRNLNNAAAPCLK